MKITKIRMGRRVVYDVGELRELVEQRRRSASRADQRGQQAGLFRLSPAPPDDVA